MDVDTQVAVLSRSFSRNAQLRQELGQRFAKVRFNDEGRSLAGQALVDFMAGAERVIVALEKVDEALLAALPGLKVIGKYGVGCDNIDLEACARHGVMVGWTPGVNRLSVAELALSFMISCLHRANEGHRQVLGGGWTQLLGRQLSGKTVGIVGFGFVGAEVARLLQPFRCEILVHDIRDRSEIASLFGARQVPLDEVIARSSVISLHLPSTAATHNLMNRARIMAMAPGSVLINTARGGIVDEAALLDALTSGHLGAAAFDVFAVEPPVANALIDLPTVVATPHIGGSTEEAVLAMGRAAIAGLDNARDPKILMQYFQ